MKTVMLGVRVCPEERAALAEVARRERLTASEMTRYLLRQAAERYGVWPPEDASAAPAECRGKAGT